MSERPEDLLYGFEDKPTFVQSFLLAMQFIVSNFISLALFIIVLSSIHSAHTVATNALSVTMLIIGLITLAQAIKLKRFGAGLLLPPSVAPTYLAQSLIAAKLGGLPLVYGMTIIAGLFQTFFSVLIRFLKRFFPAEIASLVLLLIGIDLGYLGIQFYSESLSKLPATHTSLFYVSSFLPIVLILIFDQFFKGFMKLYGIAIATIISYLVIYFSGFIPASELEIIKHAPWLQLMHFNFHYQFNWNLAVPFAIGAIVCVIKITGAIAALQEVQSKNLVQPDLRQISQGSIIDGLGTLIGGLLGAMGFNGSSSIIALQLSKKVTSRYIGFFMAAIMITLSFVAKISLVFVFLPKVIMAAILLDLGVTLTLSSIRILMLTLKTMRNFIIIGIALVIGLSNSIYPEIYHSLPSDIKMFTGSSMILAAVVAIVLNIIFVKPKDSSKPC